MKTNLNLLLLSLLSFGVLISCKNNNNTVNIANTSISTASSSPNTVEKPLLTFSTKEFSSYADQAIAKYEVSIVEGRSPEAKFVNQIIFKAMGGSDANAKKANYNYQEMANNFVKAAAQLQSNSKEEIGHCDSENFAAVNYITNNFVSIRASSTEYTGDIQSKNLEFRYNLNLQSLSILSNNDLISDELGLRKLLTTLLNKQLKKESSFKDKHKNYFKENGLYRLPEYIWVCTDEVIFEYYSRDLFDATADDNLFITVKLTFNEAQPFLNIKL